MSSAYDDESGGLMKEGEADGGYTAANLGVPGSTERPVLNVVWQDAIWGGAFVLHAAVVVFMAFGWGIAAVNFDAQKPSDDPTRNVFDLNASVISRVLCIACVVGGFSAIIFIGVLQRFASSLIKMSLYLSIFVQFVVCCGMFAVAPLFGAILMIPLAITCLYTYYARNRIAFASAHVEIAAEVVKTYPQLYMFSLAVVFLQFTWTMLWSLAALGIEYAANTTGGTVKGSSTTGGVLFFGMLVSLFWGAMLISYIGHFVTAATVGSWWFVGTSSLNPVKDAVKRAFTTSLGSLSLGALIVAVLEALRNSAKSLEHMGAKNEKLRIFAVIASCIIGLVERLVEYFNSWAVVMIALTGQDFKSAGMETMSLFTNRGWTAVINDELVGPALRLACFIPACFSAIAGAALAYGSAPSLLPDDRFTLGGLAAFVSFVIGYAMASVLSGVIISGVRAVFVCFALNPAALGVTHPEALTRLITAWNVMYPQVLNDCGYANHFQVQNPV